MAKKKINAEAQAILSAMDAGLFATTESLLNAFLTKHPDSQRGWIDLGRTLSQMSRYVEAESAFNKAIDLGDEASDAIYGEIGNLYRAQGDYPTAIHWYQKQIDGDPSDATGYLYLGNLLLRQGNLDKAKSVVESGLKCERVCLEEAHYLLGLVFRSQSDWAMAQTHFAKALEFDERFAAAKVALKDVKTRLH